MMSDNKTQYSTTQHNTKQQRNLSIFLSRFYRLKPKRNLGNLFGVGSGGCTDVHSGIGSVSFVKDILTETVVTTDFSCSKFGPHFHASLGWVTTILDV